MIETGILKERIEFSKRIVTDDGHGNERSDFTPQFVIWARRKFLVGGEAVQSARLTGTTPVLLQVRATSWTRQITSDWRARDERTNEKFNIRSVTPSEDKTHIDFLCDMGGPDG
jgi:head-tail adaptor